MKFELYKDMVLTRDLPEERLKRGDIVKLVEHHVARDGEEGYSAEVFNALGETLTVITVPESALEPLREDEVCSARMQAPEGTQPVVITDRRTTDSVDGDAAAAVRIAHVVDDPGGGAPGAPVPDV